jgi:DNA gyrase/topoisomerase IV subunit A
VVAERFDDRAARVRLGVLEALLAAARHFVDVATVVGAATDAQMARVELAEQFGWTPFEVEHVLDLRVRQLSLAAIAEWTEEAERLRQTLDDLPS